MIHAKLRIELCEVRGEDLGMNSLCGSVCATVRIVGSNLRRGTGAAAELETSDAFLFGCEVLVFFLLPVPGEIPVVLVGLFFVFEPLRIVSELNKCGATSASRLRLGTTKEQECEAKFLTRRGSETK